MKEKGVWTTGLGLRLVHTRKWEQRRVRSAIDAIDGFSLRVLDAPINIDASAAQEILQSITHFE